MPPDGRQRTGHPERKREGGETSGHGETRWDNDDPAHLIQRVEIHGDSINVIDNIPIEKAKQLFEEAVRESENPVISDLREKAQREQYQPTDAELGELVDWLSKPQIFLDEGHLQKMYDYPEGSAWEFLLHALGKKKIPSPKERIEKNYLAYLHTYDFTDEQIKVLKKIKEVFASNVTSKRSLEVDDIFGNSIYERLIGSHDAVNRKFDGRFDVILTDMKRTFGFDRSRPAA